MASIDLREALNTISDVVQNRPPAIRDFDQIYMKFGDMLLQAEHAGRKLDNKATVFIGDGDSMGLCMMHLKKRGLLKAGPKSIHILDFDERIVNSINDFSKRFKMTNLVKAEVYNVADPIPRHLWARFDGFYTNPPFGAKNGARSVLSFLRRGIEATRANAVGCLVMADYPDLSWSNKNIQAVEKFVLEAGFILSEMVPEFHSYHLDDVPDLTSCSMTLKRISFKKKNYESQPLDSDTKNNFYGQNRALVYKTVRDLREGNKFKSRDYRLEYF